MGFRISDLVKATRVLGDFPLETVDTTEPNDAKRSKYITLDQLREFVLTGLPPQPARWVEQPAISLPVVAGQQATFTVSAGQAQWPEGLVDYIAKNFTVDLPGPGLQRIDTVVADPEGGFVLVAGDASQNPSPKKQPVDTLFVNFVLFNEQGGEVPPSQGIDFNYASYTEKATPADSAVFLVQEASGTKYKWSLTQLIAWLGTKNIGAGGGGTTEVAFASALKFDKSYKTTRNAAVADALTLASNPAPVYHNRHTIYYTAGSVKPTFSASFVALWDNWKQDAPNGNIVTCVYLPSGKVGYDIRYC